MTKLQTIDAIMEGREPGSVKVRDPKWDYDYFIPYFRDVGGTWHGLQAEGYPAMWPGNCAEYELVRPVTAYYQWLMRDRRYGSYRVSFDFYKSRDEAAKCIDTEFWQAVRRLDYTRTEIEEGE